MQDSKLKDPRNFQHVSRYRSSIFVRTYIVCMICLFERNYFTLFRLKAFSEAEGSNMVAIIGYRAIKRS